MKAYLKTHEWIEATNEESYELGISKHAVEKLGDVVFIEKIENKDIYEAGETLLILESVKAVADVYAPFKCKVSKYNEDMIENPESLNAADALVHISPLEEIRMSKYMDESSYLAALETT
ncbi:MAG: glycine cleavage system protein H [Candidatus Caenarcaniphilales bacterium]|nr:glycine cleavage system protein H [Candidatus Caenarcaniphilales bacterium]